MRLNLTVSPNGKAVPEEFTAEASD